MKSIHAPSGASFLEELKAAQAQIAKDVDGLYYSLEGNFPYIDVSDEEGSREVAAVLRRIPQLIEVVEWLVKEQERLERASQENDPENLFKKEQISLGLVIGEILSKFAPSEGKASEDAAGATRPLEGKKDGE